MQSPLTPEDYYDAAAVLRRSRNTKDGRTFCPGQHDRNELAQALEEHADRLCRKATRAAENYAAKLNQRRDQGAR
jgi:hypothetical protein